VQLADLHYIGKESNDWEEQFYLGADDEAIQDYGPLPLAAAQLLDEARAADRKYGRRTLADAAGLSSRHLTTLLRGGVKNPTPRKLAKLRRGIARLEAMEREGMAREQRLVTWAQEECGRYPVAEVAKRLRYDEKNLRKVIKGDRAVSRLLMLRIENVRGLHFGDRT
jgi:AraC-like DNA-binding protein